MHHIPVLNNILFAFGAEFSGVAGGGFSLTYYIVVIGDGFGADESFFKIGVDFTGGLGGFGPAAQRPCAGFLGPHRKKRH